MTVPADATEPDDGLLAEFLRQLEAADDRAAVVRRWCEAHPRLASDLSALAATDHMLAGVRADGESPPERLGDFRIVRRIGRGGMGVVYEAVQEPFGRRVAVKTCRPLHFSESARARFLREQAVLARLHHTHVVAVFAAGQAGDVHYFAMPFIDGVSLREAFRSLSLAGGAERLDEAHFRATAGRIADAAEAISHAHEKGIIHRDLTPANLMLDTEGQVWVLDFGLAGYPAVPAEPPPEPSAGDDATLSLPGATLGTLNYMAPEQLDGRADVRTDVWGLGAILYELLTLRRAYAEPDGAGGSRNESGFDRRRRELAAALVPPRRLAPHVPRDLEAICQKCLRPRPEDRYARAHDLAEDLRRYLRGDETAARPLGLAERVTRWGRRQPAHAALTALVGVLLLLLALVAGHVGEMRAGNARAADKLARSVDKQFRLVEQAVTEVAKREELRRRMADFAGDPKPLHDEITRLSHDAHERWFRRPGEEQPFVNWFVMDPKGHILADPYPKPMRPILGQEFGFRDYARCLFGADAPADPEPVYVSRVFLSEQDGKYKFAAVSRVWEGNRLLGLVAATIAIDSKLVALDMRAEPLDGGVIGRMDRNPRHPGREDENTRLPQYAFVLHRDYDGSGLCRRDADDCAGVLGSFDADPTPAHRTDSFFRGGRLWLADYARAGDTHFVAVAEQPYPWEVNLILWAAALAAGVALAAIARRAWARFRRARRPALSV